MKKIYSALLAIALLCSAVPTSQARAAELPAAVTPGLCRIKTDMETARWNYQSRTKTMPHIPGGITPMTYRFGGGVSNVPLTKPWQDFLLAINGGNEKFVKYANHIDSGWINKQLWRAEELGFGNQNVLVEMVSGYRAYIKTFYVNQSPPQTIDPNDPRIQYFTIVTRDNKVIFAPPGKVKIFLIARGGERLWIPVEYLDCPDRGPYQATVHTPGSRLNVRLSPGGEFVTTLNDGTPITIFRTENWGGAAWGLTTTQPGSLPGWVALRWTTR